MNATVEVYLNGNLLHTDAFSTLKAAKHYASLINNIQDFHALLVY